MEIISVGYDFRHGKEFSISRLYGLKEYLFLIIRSTALFYINGQKLHIMPNSMILIDKNTPHSFYADSKLFINDWISFSIKEKDNLSDFENTVKLNTFFNSSDVAICSEMIRFISNEETSVSIFKETNMQNMLQIIFNKLRDNSEYCKPDKQYYKELQKLRNSIYSNPTEKYTIEQLVQEVCLSKSYFQRCYKLYFNITPIADVIRSRIKYSKQLLLTTNFSISEIAEILGYQNDIQFIKQFKHITKKTPGQYRKAVTSN